MFLARLAKKYPGDDFVLISDGCRATDARAMQFYKSGGGVPFTVVRRGFAPHGKGSYSIPYMLVFDRSGKIVCSGEVAKSAKEIEKAIDEAVEEARSYWTASLPPSSSSLAGAIQKRERLGEVMKKLRSLAEKASEPEKAKGYLETVRRLEEMKALRLEGLKRLQKRDPLRWLSSVEAFSKMFAGCDAEIASLQEEAREYKKDPACREEKEADLLLRKAEALLDRIQWGAKTTDPLVFEVAKSCASVQEKFSGTPAAGRAEALRYRAMGFQLEAYPAFWEAAELWQEVEKKGADPAAKQKLEDLCGRILSQYPGTPAARWVDKYQKEERGGPGR